ncbi:MAG TPA: hypothetical protein VM621_15805 [Luteibacter sp.]|uniref:hypothetical protein n=1 Tax=Luteibacter sp. TaxID=1886636 RepID=UPI002BEA4E6F|nr:hypothetical protein [Luteibacter sp.]HVI56509.1 hypothetical protein [Luteibacter sp.]
MKHSIFSWVPLFAATFACPALLRAQSLCTADLPHQPPRVETSLGAGVDDVVYASTRYRGGVANLKQNDWKFFYGTAAFTDRKKRQIFIIRGASDLNMASQFAHETGHAKYSARVDYSSRDAYVRTRCRDEGAALSENIVLREAVKMCTGSEMGIVTAEPALMQAKYDELAEARPIDLEALGYFFCEKNINSVTHQNYLDYYGDWWTQNYGKAALALVPPSGDSAFWTKIALLAGRANQGVDALEKIWPMSSSPFRLEEDGATASLFGDEAWFSGGVTVERSEIRLRSTDNEQVALASLDISGVCIGLNEVRAHYPGIVGTGTAHPGVPDGEATWTAYGDWGGLWFAFPMANPKCLSGVSFHPGEVDAPSDDYDYPSE